MEVEEMLIFLKMLWNLGLVLFFLTRDLKLVVPFINVIEKHIDITDLIMNDKNYKDMLLQLFQKQNGDINL